MRFCSIPKNNEKNLWKSLPKRVCLFQWVTPKWPFRQNALDLEARQTFIHLHTTFRLSNKTGEMPSLQLYISTSRSAGQNQSTFHWGPLRSTVRASHGWRHLFGADCYTVDHDRNHCTSSVDTSDWDWDCDDGLVAKKPRMWRIQNENFAGLAKISRNCRVPVVGCCDEVLKMPSMFSNSKRVAPDAACTRCRKPAPKIWAVLYKIVWTCINSKPFPIGFLILGLQKNHYALVSSYIISIHLQCHPGWICLHGPPASRSCSTASGHVCTSAWSWYVRKNLSWYICKAKQIFVWYVYKRKRQHMFLKKCAFCIQSYSSAWSSPMLCVQYARVVCKQSRNMRHGQKRLIHVAGVRCFLVSSAKVPSKSIPQRRGVIRATRDDFVKIQKKHRAAARRNHTASTSRTRIVQLSFTSFVTSTHKISQVLKGMVKESAGSKGISGHAGHAGHSSYT